MMVINGNDDDEKYTQRRDLFAQKFKKSLQREISWKGFPRFGMALGEVRMGETVINWDLWENEKNI